VPLRVAFLGHTATYGAHALHTPAGGLDPSFVDVRDGDDPAELRAALSAVSPHVVVSFAPDRALADVLAGSRAALLAVVSAQDEAPAGFDRVLRTPGPGAEHAWRSRPLPVDDRLYAEVHPMDTRPRALCLARSTKHREWVLTPAKHSHDVVHYAHGLSGDMLAGVLAATDIGIALVREPGSGFPAQALLHVAAGQLLLSEQLVPDCGFETGIDFLPFYSRDELLTLLMQVELRPDAYERVRIRGRLKAEEHRASRVWPRIVADLLQDVRVFGNTLNA
jgi:hypothetical protein